MTPEELCLALVHADREDDVVRILTDAGYWDDPHSWRYIGDKEQNFGEIGNQQSEPVAALVEKIVNGVDARLTNACLEAGIDPEDVAAAPASIREAVAGFFEGKSTFHADRDGRIADWTSKSATEQGLLLTLAATGHKPGEGRPSLSIADQGEGQTPDNFPYTFMSLGRSNKLRIHFVQGKFNMGGTGALTFCSDQHGFQLVVSRRNPALLGEDASNRDHEWGFTIVRRSTIQGARSPVFTYLAPVGASEATAGGVLSFARDKFPIFPEDPKRKDRGANAYAREAPHGSLIKLYEYDWQGTKSNIVMAGEGLLRRVDVALPELGLPLRLFECRPYRGGPASFSTNALGLVARLEQDKAENLEPDFPSGTNLTLDGKHIPVRAYAFRPDRAKQYRQSRYGIVFTVNGQMHAAFPIDFFRRKTVNLGHIADSLLVVVDCTQVDELMRADLFMNSRDRLRDKPLARRLEEELERYLKRDSALRALQNARRAERNEERLSDDRPLADVLQSVLKSNPLLSRLFQHGLRLSAPFPPAAGAGGGSADTYSGKRFPTYFRFKGKASGDELKRDAQLGRRIRVALETDATDDYFLRDAAQSPGTMRVRLRQGDDWEDVLNYSPGNLRSGVVQLWIHELPDGAAPGDVFDYRIEVTDDSRVEAFVNDLHLTVAEQTPGGPGGKGSPKSSNKGKGKTGGPRELALPNFKDVHEHEWSTYGMDEHSALTIELGDVSEDDDQAVYDFYVNVDNRYLRIAQKEGRSDPNLLEKQFLYGMVLVGLAFVQEHAERTDKKHDSSEAETAPRYVANATRALAPILLPIIESIGGLSLDDTL